MADESEFQEGLGKVGTGLFVAAGDWAGLAVELFCASDTVKGNTKYKIIR